MVTVGMCLTDANALVSPVLWLVPRVVLHPRLPPWESAGHIPKANCEGALASLSPQGTVLPPPAVTFSTSLAASPQGSPAEQPVSESEEPGRAGCARSQHRPLIYLPSALCHLFLYCFQHKISGSHTALSFRDCEVHEFAEFMIRPRIVLVHHSCAQGPERMLLLPDVPPSFPFPSQEVGWPPASPPLMPEPGSARSSTSFHSGKWHCREHLRGKEEEEEGKAGGG